MSNELVNPLADTPPAPPAPPRPEGAASICGGCDKTGPSMLMLLVKANNARRCVACATADAYSGAMPDGEGLVVSGAFIKALITAAAPQQRQTATDGAGVKVCKRGDCNTPVNGNFALCYQHGQEAPYCDCANGKRVGWNVRTNNWFAMCYDCNRAVA